MTTKSTESTKEFTDEAATNELSQQHKSVQHCLKDEWLTIEHQHTHLAVEAAIALVINGIHYAVLMASPSHLELLAYGFLFSEGLISRRQDVLDCEVINLNALIQTKSQQMSSNPVVSKHLLADHMDTDLNDANNLTNLSSSLKSNSQMWTQLQDQLQDHTAFIIEIRLNQRCHHRIKAQQRQLAGRTGCGMCGMTGLSQAMPNLTQYQTLASTVKSSRPNLSQLLRLKQALDDAQKTHQLTGSVHAAATWHDNNLIMFEDVGRHNALDKMIGWQLKNGVLGKDIMGVLMTSRLSIELVQKAIRQQLLWLIGISAPTSTAVNVANRYGLGIAGFLRDNRVTFY